ncbi:MAG: hypothetical protein U5K79_07170 [Cyclobacteriaceae bacterium]|nr:hypothetical protein [Cyclobacteriaceae bacterium]
MSTIPTHNFLKAHYLIRTEAANPDALSITISLKSFPWKSL